MPDSKRHSFNFVPGSSAYEIYIGRVDNEIDDGGAKFRKKLAALARITEGELHDLLKSYSTAEIEAAIAERDAQESQSGQADPDKPKEPQTFGWLDDWQRAKDEREERNSGE